MFGGYLLTEHLFRDHAFDYLFWMLLAAMSAGSIVLHVRHWPRQCLPLVALLGLFVVGYYVQFYWSALVPETISVEIHWDTERAARNQAVLLEVYRLLGLSFLAFAIAVPAALFLFPPRCGDAPLPKTPPPHRERASLARVLLFVVPPGAVFTGLTMHVFGVSVAGRESVYLPFHLSGLLHYLHAFVLPALLLTAIWLSEEAGAKSRGTLGRIAMIVHGAATALLRASRGTLLSFITLLFILDLTSRRLHARRLLPVLGFVLISGLLWPFFTAYRVARADFPGEGVGFALSHGFDALGEGREDTMSNTLLNGLENMIRRIGNIYSLMILVWVKPEPIGLHNVFLHGAEPTRVLTVEVLGFPRDAPHNSAASLPGWFYLVGGEPLVILGMALFVFSVWVAWAAIGRFRFTTLPVGQAMSLFWLAHVAPDGVLDRWILWPLTLFASVVIPELVLRTWLRGSPARHRAQGAPWPGKLEEAPRSHG
ncbi:MAG: hypothetical protein IT371_29185 [Deltaproteobacteria bacterium]|nr:hypothetical protein [Deltaproteobacteria bacterium]